MNESSVSLTVGRVDSSSVVSATGVFCGVAPEGGSSSVSGEPEEGCRIV